MDAAEPADLIIGPIEIRTIERLPQPTADPWWVDEIVCRGRVEASGARIELEGQIPSRNFQFFLADLQAVYDSLDGTATLDGDDLGVIVSIKALPAGHMSVSAMVLLSGIWSDPFHARFQLDQTHLRPMLSQCRAILRQFPVRADRALL